MNGVKILLLFCALFLGMHTPGGAQKGLVEFDWSIATTSRRDLVVTPLQLNVFALPTGRRVVDLSSVGANDTAAANLTSSRTATREFFSAPVDAAGILTVETSAGETRGSGNLAVAEIPYNVSRRGAQFGLPRYSPSALGAIGRVLGVLSAPSFLTGGYTGTARLRITPLRPGLATESPVLRLRAFGAVSILSRELLIRATLHNHSDTPGTEQIPFAIPAGERGMIEAEVSIPSSPTSNYRSTQLFLLAGQRRLYVGTGGFGALEVQHLNDQVAAGLMSLEEYRRRVAAVLSEGTKQTVRTIEPAP